MELLKVISIYEAKKIIQERSSYQLISEKVDIRDCVGRINYSEVVAPCNIPEFRKSTVDGFAVNSKDIFGASESMPSIMELKGEVKIGTLPPGRININGECFYVPTGGMLPFGSDSVVMAEYTETLDESTILINEPTAFGDNVIQVGEDITFGEVVIETGEKLRPYEVGVLASLGISEIEVYKKPKVAIISTGDEVVPFDAEPQLGQVRDINTFLLWSALQQDGAEPMSYGIMKDDFKKLKSATEEALENSDIVLISGGSSAGNRDHTLEVIAACENSEILVHGLAVKPGKPTIIGKVGEKMIFGLPGHPLAAAIIYKILVKDYINKLMRHREEEYGIQAVVSMNYHKAKGREEYLPVTLQRIDGRVIAKPVFGKSGIITAFSKAYGYIRIEKNTEGLSEGQSVEVNRL